MDAIYAAIRHPDTGLQEAHKVIAACLEIHPELQKIEGIPAVRGSDGGMTHDQNMMSVVHNDVTSDNQSPPVTTNSDDELEDGSDFEPEDSKPKMQSVPPKKQAAPKKAAEITTAGDSTLVAGASSATDVTSTTDVKSASDQSNVVNLGPSIHNKKITKKAGLHGISGGLSSFKRKGGSLHKRTGGSLHKSSGGSLHKPKGGSLHGSRTNKLTSEP